MSIYMKKKNHHRYEEGHRERENDNSKILLNIDVINSYQHVESGNLNFVDLQVT